MNPNPAGARGTRPRPPTAITRKILTAILAISLFLGLTLVLQRLLTPKYMSNVYEGALTREYYASEMNHQVLFIGDCEVYENVSPMAMWRGFGLTSYIRGGAQQLIWQSYYLLEDALRYETPEVVVFSVLAMMYGKPQSEAYNRLNLEGMRTSLTKYRAVTASLTTGEDALSYFFPILRYHERWKTLGSEDLAYFAGAKRVSHNGFIIRCDVFPPGEIPAPLRLASYDFAPLCWEYLDKMRELCQKKGIELVLMKAPSLFPAWYPEWEAQIRAYAEQNGLIYLNFLELGEETGIDMTTDTYDGGLHLNVYGAEKLALYLGETLRKAFDLADLRGDEAVAAAWAKKERLYDAMKASQEQELKQTGKISTFTY